MILRQLSFQRYASEAAKTNIIEDISKSMSVAGPEGPGDAHAFAYIFYNIRFCGLGRIPLEAQLSHNHFGVRQLRL